MFDRIVWWSVWRRIRRWFERCHEVCSHTNIWCFLWMYRNVQFKHCIGSFVFALFDISRSSCSIGNTINWSVYAEHSTDCFCLSRSSMPNTVVNSTLVRGHHYHRTTLQWSTFSFIDPREELRRKPIIPIFGTKAGRRFQCWRNVFLTEALNQRTKSNWTEFISIESCI